MTEVTEGADPPSPPHSAKAMRGGLGYGRAGVTEVSYVGRFSWFTYFLYKKGRIVL